MSKTNVNDVLKDNGRGGTGGTGARRWTGALVMVEVVLTIVLLSGAGFMMRSFMSLYQMDTGFNYVQSPRHGPLPAAHEVSAAGPRDVIYQQFADRLAAIPAIQASALTNNAPFNGAPSSRFGIDGETPGDDQSARRVSVVAVGDSYFDALGVRLRRGRAFQRDDGLPGKGVAVVNEKFVALHSPGADPVGRQIKLMDTPTPEWISIVGVVPNVRQNNPRNPDPDPVVYVPLRSNPQRTPTLFIRTSSSAAVVMPQVRDALRAVEPDLPLFNVQTMDERLAQSRWQFVVFGIDVRDIRWNRADAVGARIVLGDDLFRDAADAGNRRANGARGAAWLDPLARAAPRADSTRDRVTARDRGRLRCRQDTPEHPGAAGTRTSSRWCRS